MSNISTEDVFWVVWNPGHGNPSMRHSSDKEARGEAERLAERNPGQKFYVLRGVGLAHVEKPTIYKKLDDGIPF